MKRFLKITFWILFTIFLLLYAAFFYVSQPKSDEVIIEKFKNKAIDVKLSHQYFNNLKYRKLEIFNSDTLPTFVFVHGTIGSCLDFFEYMVDKDLKTKANFISYDRIGYNFKDTNPPFESILQEKLMLQQVTANLTKENTILVGYSYGGPIALSDFSKYKKVILVAPAVYSKVEPMPWFLNIYNWKLTRWLLPQIWKNAGKEKLSHQQDLKNFEENWNANPNQILVFHGTDDVIVPLTNSLYLQKVLPKNRFELVTIPNAGHALVWTEFETIKTYFLE